MRRVLYSLTYARSEVQSQWVILCLYQPRRRLVVMRWLRENQHCNVMPEVLHGGSRPASATTRLAHDWISFGVQRCDRWTARGRQNSRHLVRESTTQNQCTWSSRVRAWSWGWQLHPSKTYMCESSKKDLQKIGTFESGKLRTPSSI